MAIFTIKCDGGKWQDDFMRIFTNVDNYFHKIFRDDDEASNAILMFMERFADCWEQGETISLTTNFTVYDVLQGRTFVPRGNTGGRHGVRSVISYSNRCEYIARVRARLYHMLAWVDYRLHLETLPDRDASIIKLVMAGHRMQPISRKLRTSPEHIKRVVRVFCAELSQ